MSNSEQPLGVDISSYQGTKINYEMMKEKTRFVAMRAGISFAFEDPTFDANWQGLKGHNRIAYHVVYPSQDPIRQADWFLFIVNSYGFDYKTDRLALDIELPQGQSRERISSMVEQMMEHIESITGREPILYSAKWFVDPNMRITPRLANADWWIANYAAKESPPGTEHLGPPLLPNGIESWLIHQTSETGISKRYGCTNGHDYIDLDRWNGTDEDMQSYFSRHELAYPIIVVPDEPEPELPEPLYEAKVNTYPDRLRVRNKPSILGGFVRWLMPNDVVPVFEERNGWAKLAANAAEWSMAKYLSPVRDAGLEFWSQRDPRWANDRMGSSNITLGQQGCLVTATSWLLKRLGIDIDPRQYNILASTWGGYAHPNLMYWLFPEVMWGVNGRIAKLGIQRAEYKSFNGKGWQSAVDAILDDGRDVLACVDMVPGGAFNQHWVTIYARDGGDYLFMDPWHGDSAKISERYFDIYKVVSYRRTK